jgi:hypothetical protein
MINKITDEITFFIQSCIFSKYDTRFYLPSLGLISKQKRVIMQVAKNLQKTTKHGLKLSLANNSVQLHSFTLCSSEYAKEMGISDYSIKTITI